MHTRVGSSPLDAKGLMVETRRGGMCDVACSPESEPTSITTASMTSARVKAEETEARMVVKSTTVHCADERM